MKKCYFLVLLLILTANFSFAQWTTSGNNIYYTAGAVGIGTTSPNAALTVIGTVLSSVPGAGGDNNNLMLGNPSAASNTNDLRAGIWLDNDGRLKFRSVTGYGMAFRSTSNTFDILNITDGGLSIGAQTLPSGYSFAVNGNAIATSFTVQAYANWPDYVFKSGYKLPPLNLVKAYIDQNHHLPDVPSAEQVAKDGFNLGDMNKVTMQKVEELTLYLIEKDEKINEQQKQINEQGKRLEKLEATLNQLTAAKADALR
ncbi:hypothetical protein [Mucilaginibacter sp.]